MTKNEYSHVAGFLRELKDRFSNDGCNDLDLPNTPENVQLLCAAIKWGCGTDASEMIQDVFAQVQQEDEFLHTTNSILCGYLIHLAQEESR